MTIDIGGSNTVFGVSCIPFFCLVCLWADLHMGAVDDFLQSVTPAKSPCVDFFHAWTAYYFFQLFTVFERKGRDALHLVRQYDLFYTAAYERMSP